MCMTEGARSVRLLRVSGKLLHSNHKKEWQIILPFPRVELTLANADDADCDDFDNDLY